MRHFILIFETLIQAGNRAFVCLGDFADAAVINKRCADGHENDDFDTTTDSM